MIMIASNTVIPSPPCDSQDHCLNYLPRKSTKTEHVGDVLNVFCHFSILEAVPTATIQKHRITSTILQLVFLLYSMLLAHTRLVSGR